MTNHDKVVWLEEHGKLSNTGYSNKNNRQYATWVSNDGGAAFGARGPTYGDMIDNLYGDIKISLWNICQR